jgi:hypothetical protein
MGGSTCSLSKIYIVLSKKRTSKSMVYSYTGPIVVIPMTSNKPNLV